MVVMPRAAGVLLGIAVAVSAACSRSNPPAPSPGGNQGETITGRERLGWDQQAGGAGELATFRYAIYVDGMRVEMADVACANAAGPNGFACNGRLPSMAAGTHVLELATFVMDGTILESARSAPLRVTVTGAVAGGGDAIPWTSGDAGVTSDGVPLRIDRLAEGLVEPVDAAAAPDGRLFIAERGGRLMVLDGGDLTPAPMQIDDELQESGALLSIALDVAFAETRVVYVLYAAPTSDGLAYRLARFREVGGRLGERAVLMNRIAVAEDAPSGVVRGAPDGTLLIAIGQGSGQVVRRAGDRAPVPILAGLAAPAGLAVDAARGVVWVADGRDDGGVVNAVALDGTPPAVRLAQRFKDRDARSMAVYAGAHFPTFAGDLLIASADARRIVRMRIDVASGRVQGEALLEDQVGGVRVVAVGPDGAIYFCTADAVGVIRKR
jgi:hypothetical protein